MRFVVVLHQLVDGKAKFEISTESFKMSRGNWQITVDPGNRLVVEANVLDRATSKREYTVDDSAIFATSPYLVTFKHTPKDFKPGVGTIIVVSTLCNVFLSRFARNKEAREDWLIAFS